MIWLAMGGTLLGTVLTGAVLGAALGLTGFVILHVWSGGATSLGVQAVWNTFNSFTLTAIPLFILLGEVLVASGLAARVYRAMAPVFARLPGGLLHTNIAVCGMFGAVSGSSMAVAGRPVTSTAQLLNAVAALKPQSQARIQVQRGDQQLDLNVKVAQRPKPGPRPE